MLMKSNAEIQENEDFVSDESKTADEGMYKSLRGQQIRDVLYGESDLSVISRCAFLWDHCDAVASIDTLIDDIAITHLDEMIRSHIVRLVADVAVKSTFEISQKVSENYLKYLCALSPQKITPDSNEMHVIRQVIIALERLRPTHIVDYLDDLLTLAEHLPGNLSGALVLALSNTAKSNRILRRNLVTELLKVISLNEDNISQRESIARSILIELTGEIYSFLSMKSVSFDVTDFIHDYSAVDLGLTRFSANEVHIQLYRATVILTSCSNLQDVMQRNQRGELNKEQKSKLLHEVRVLQNKIIEELVEFLRADGIAILRLDGASTKLESDVSIGIKRSRYKSTLNLGSGIIANIVEEQIPRIIKNTSISPREEHIFLGVKSYLCYPLTVGNKVKGLLIATNSNPDAFNFDHIIFLSIPIIAIAEAMASAWEFTSQANLIDAHVMLSDAAHYLKTPVSTLKTHTSGLRRELGTNPLNARIKFRVETIEDNANILTRMIDNALDLTVIQAGSSLENVVMEDLLICGVIEEVSTQVRIAATDREIEMKIISEKDLKISGSKSHLVRAIYEIVDNAIKRSERGSRIEISADRSDDKVRILIRNYGEQFDPDLLPRIFEMYVSDGKGIGFGLPFSKHIIGDDMHMGSISPIPRDDGAEFEIFLPLLIQ